MKTPEKPEEREVEKVDEVKKADKVQQEPDADGVREGAKASRRTFLKTAATVGVGAATGIPTAAEAFDFDRFFQQNFRALSGEDLQELLGRLEEKYSKQYGKNVTMSAVGPMANSSVSFGSSSPNVRRMFSN